MGNDGGMGITDEKALQLQVALLLADILLEASTDSACQEALQRTLALHNVGEYQLVAYDVCKLLIATTHPSVDFSLECKKVKGLCLHQLPARHSLGAGEPRNSI
jgi:hypothetical protein